MSEAPTVLMASLRIVSTYSTYEASGPARSCCSCFLSRNSCTVRNSCVLHVCLPPFSSGPLGLSRGEEVTGYKYM